MRNLRSSDAAETEITLKSNEFCLFLLDALSQEDIRDKLRCAIGYNEDKLSKNIIDTFSSKIKHLEDKIEKKDQRITVLENEVETLKEKHDEYKQYSRRNILHISGLPETLPSDDAVLKLCSKTLNVNLSKADIDRSHRIGTQINATAVAGRIPSTQPLVPHHLSQRSIAQEKHHPLRVQVPPRKQKPPTMAKKTMMMMTKEMTPVLWVLPAEW